MLLLIVNWCLTLHAHEISPVVPSLEILGHDNFEISFIPENNTQIGPLSLVHWHFHNGFKIPSKRGAYHVLLSLLLGGNVHPHPGPGPGRPPKYPCGECHRAVRMGASLSCDRCGTWFHKDCLQMQTVNFEAHQELSWSCCNCALPNCSQLFDTIDSLDITLDSLDSPNPGQPRNQSSPIVSQLRNKRDVRRLNTKIINFDSILAKRSALEATLENENIDVILGCESKLSSDIIDSEFLPEGYVCWRNDRNRHGGGVIVIHKDDLKVTQVNVKVKSEVLAVKIECQGKKPLIMCAAYRPPDNDRQYMDQMCADIKLIHNSYPGCAFWCGGDFNLPDIDWTNEIITSNRYPVEINQSLLDLLCELNLTQLVNFPTRAVNTLELLFTNRPSLVHEMSPHPGISDHDSIVFTRIDCLAQVKRPISRKVHQWHKLTDEKLKDVKSFVKSAAGDIVTNCTVDTPVEDIWQQIKNISSDVLEKVPAKMTSRRFNQTWVNRTVRRLFRRKRRAYNRARRTNREQDWEHFRELRREAQRACNKAKADHVARRVSTDADKTRKSLYRYVKNSRTDNNGVSTLEVNGRSFSTPKEKANALNRQFSSVFSPISDSVPDLGPAKASSIPDIVFEVNGIKALLKNTKTNKSSGPDNISAKFLKETGDELAPALTLLFQASMHQSQIPDDWRHARVSPQYKTGKNNRSVPANYRPISLTCIVCKMMEHCVTSHLMGHLDKHNLLTDYQHGFRKKRSCETQLILTVDDISKALKDQKQVDCILLDFAKAFDKVSHKKLIAKLKHNGVDGSTLLWIEDFLRSRTQVVVVDGEESDVAPVTSGVPQGTVLGPALFLVYINDLPDGLTCTPRLFADDCLLYRVINSDADTEAIQADLHTLEAWERKWDMEFAEDKCKVLTITLKYKRNIKMKDYQIHNYVLKRVDNADYLGVKLDSKLNFNAHIGSLCKKATSARQFLQRTLPACDRKTKAQTYTTFVRPIVEYAATAWDPHNCKGLKKQRDHLEDVQSKCARYVTGQWKRQGSSVSGMKAQLGWDSLQERRAKARILMMHKVKYGYVAIPSHLLVVKSNTTMVTRGAVNKHHVPNSRIIPRERSFMYAAPTMWDGLPPHMTSESDHDNFRVLLAPVVLVP